MVDVPASAPAVTVRLDYDRADAIVDLGLIGPDHFGGWSGSERSTVTVTPTWATPGYLPGRVAGGWQVVLGLHRVGPAGVTVSVEVDTTAVERPADPIPPPRPERPPPRELPAAPGYQWLAADFHSHTVHSDGALEVAELSVLAASRGLDVLAITDHNTISHHGHLEAAGQHAGILLVPGQEVTTDQGHANCFGPVPWIDFREPPDAWRQTTDAHGGVMAVNHPWAGDCAWRLPLAEPAPLVEMWHSTWDRTASTPLTEWRSFGGIPIGGSDFHRHQWGIVPGDPTTWIECADRTVAAVIDALRQGRVAVSASPHGPVLLRDGDDFVAIDADDCELVTTAVDSTSGRPGPAYLRAGPHVAAFTP